MRSSCLGAHWLVVEKRNIFPTECDELVMPAAPAKLNAMKTLLSKEVAVAIAAPIVGSTALIASGVGSVLGGALGVAALGKVAVDYRTSRNAVYQKHPMAFLYSGKGTRLY